MNTLENKQSAKVLIDSIKQQTKKLSEADVQTLDDFNRLKYLKSLMMQLENEFCLNIN